ncbi:MAG: UDP-N-acetylmuramoyl-L-alanine--D-glutamate ligase [Candidatus Paceibacterota bacterium]
MINFKQFFYNKKITIMGLGLLGRGVGDAIFLAECGAKLTITDLKSSVILKPSLEKLRKFKNIKFVLGKHRLEDFQNSNLILKAAGVPLDSIYIKEAKKNKIPIEMSATLFVKLSRIYTIAVTGTRGKSTVTHLIAHILKYAGKKIILGGNVRGISNLQLLKKVKNEEVAILELDSWQLQGFGDNKISPNIAVFTTFFPDHMVYYKNSMKKYFTDKINIFKYQKSGDTLIVGKQTLPFIKKWGGKIRSKIILSKTELPKGWGFGIAGEHNIANASLAVEVARILGIKDAVIKKALKNFKGVEGRMQLLKEIKGVKYYNDTTATTPEATIAALKTLGQKKNIILIAGGADKNLNMSDLLKEIPKYCKKVILLSGTGTERVKNKIKGYVEVNSLKKAVTSGMMLSSRGDIVLLSPAFASFNMFDNEYDRGDQFTKIVKNLGVQHL